MAGKHRVLAAVRGQRGGACGVRGRAGGCHDISQKQMKGEGQGQFPELGAKRAGQRAADFAENYCTSVL